MGETKHQLQVGWNNSTYRGEITPVMDLFLAISRGEITPCLTIVMERIPSWLAVYRGWNPTQLYGDHDKIIISGFL